MPSRLAPRDVVELLRRRARRLGFARLGVAAADPPLEEPARLLDWLRAGRHGRMGYLARAPERRLDPSSLLEGARSLLVASASYESAPEGAGIAAYAAAPDYHRTMREALERLAHALRRLVPGARTAVAVDTKPILERAAARRAGVGWIGKSTLLLDEGNGPYLLLGLVVTDVALPPSPPAKERCGRCTRCLDACPTGAFVAPYVLDARRCLSYWTIEHRGPMPRWIREALGERFFGCDDCLAACPFGPPAVAGRELLPVAEPLRRLDPAQALEQAQRSFRRHFGHTALSRAGKEGLLRNALTALGNRGRPGDVPLIAPFLDASSPTLRIHAAWALGKIGGEAARAALTEAHSREEDRDVLSEIEHALASSAEVPSPEVS